MSRVARQLLLAGVTLVTLGGAWLAGPAAGAVDRASLATAWLCALLFFAVLAVGPLTVRAGRQPPANLLVRRDLGIWVGLTGLLHFALGNVEAMNGRYVNAVTAAGPPFDAAARLSLFNWGAISGTVVAVVLLILLGLSNNMSLRRLGPRRWKRWQRLSYLGFALTMLHGLLFQVLENRHWPWVLVLAGGAVAVLLAQLLGRRRYSRLVAAGEAR